MNHKCQLACLSSRYDYSLIIQPGSSRRSPAPAAIAQSDRPTKWIFARSRDKFAEKTRICNLTTWVISSPASTRRFCQVLAAVRARSAASLFRALSSRNFAKRASRNLALVALRVSSRRGNPLARTVWKNSRMYGACTSLSKRESGGKMETSERRFMATCRSTWFSAREYEPCENFGSFSFFFFFVLYDFLRAK